MSDPTSGPRAASGNPHWRAPGPKLPVIPAPTPVEATPAPRPAAPAPQPAPAPVAAAVRAAPVVEVPVVEAPAVDAPAAIEPPPWASAWTTGIGAVSAAPARSRAREAAVTGWSPTAWRMRALGAG